MTSFLRESQPPKRGSLFFLSILVLIVCGGFFLQLTSAGLIKQKLSNILQKPFTKNNKHNHDDLKSNEANVLEQIESGEKRTVQAINSYLTDLNRSNDELNQNLISTQLSEAAETIERLGYDTFARLTIVDLNNIGLTKFNNLMAANDPKAAVSVMKDLLKSTKSCSDESIQFLMLIIEQETSDGQLLNKFARLLLEKCRQFEISTISYKIEKFIGKMKSDLADLIAELANIYDNIRKENLTKNNGDITIREPTIKKDSSVELLRQLKQINLDSASKLKQFALALNRYFNSQLPVDDDDNKIKLTKKDQLERLEVFHDVELIKPCSQLVEEIKTITRPLLEYKKIFPQVSLSSVFDSIRLKDKDFDYQLELFRVCRQIQDNDKQLYQMLKSMR